MENGTSSTSHNSKQCFNSFLANLLRTSASLFNHFSKAPSNFGGDNPEVAGPPPPPKAPVIGNLIV